MRTRGRPAASWTPEQRARHGQIQREWHAKKRGRVISAPEQNELAIFAKALESIVNGFRAEALNGVGVDEDFGR